MNTEIINLKIDAKTKKEAQKVAEELGFSLSSILKGYLKDFIRTKRVKFSLTEEEPEYLLHMVQDSNATTQPVRINSIDEHNAKKIDSKEYLKRLLSIKGTWFSLKEHKALIDDLEESLKKRGV